jgi:Ca-activated chloride channel homolog
MKLPLQVRFMVLARPFLAPLLTLLLLVWVSAMRANTESLAASTASNGGIKRAAAADCTVAGMLVALASGHSRKELGSCPLKHTDVRASVSGYVARVCVRQQFHNPYKEKIEAVYTFPLPHDAAVDEMTMKVGCRVIRGSIKKRQEARRIYDQARERGNVASLLDQERPNIFCQSVANIEAGENIDIEIKYVNLLKYEDGAFTFTFPTVVGPRFIPGQMALGRSGSGQVFDTDRVPDASRITPPMAAPRQRAGHDISIDLNLNAGVPIGSIGSKLHDVLIERNGATTAHIKLKNQDRIPNKDFVVSWNVAAGSVASGYLTHRQGNDGFFTLILIPPGRVKPAAVQPKEMIFLVDCSGSQAGRPIQKAKEAMEYILNHMNARDTFQIIAFSSDARIFPERPMTASAAIKARALEFIHSLEGNGGTWMAPAVQAALLLPNHDHRLRIFTIMTDGYVGNDFEIISMIKKARDRSRWFSFGTGDSVNCFLIDTIAREGGGEADYVLLNSSAEEVGKKFYDRLSSPVLTDLKIEFKGVETKEVFPRNLSELWAQRPLYFTGRYLKPGKGKVVLSGYSAGKPYRQELNLDLPAQQTANEVLPSIWARARVERLMGEDWYAVQQGKLHKELRDEIVDCALKYHIMTQYTSFVAVEEERRTKGNSARLVPVQVETPEGVNMESQAVVKGMGPVAAVPPSYSASASYSGSPNAGYFAGAEGGLGEGDGGTGSGYGSAGGDIAASVSRTPRAAGNIAPYRKDLLMRIANNWHPSNENESAAVQIQIGKDGQLVSDEMIESTGNRAADRQILEAIEATEFAPLPDFYKGESLVFKIELEKVLAITKSVARSNSPTGTAEAGRDGSRAGQSGSIQPSSKFDPRLISKISARARQFPPDQSKIFVAIELTEIPTASLLTRLEKLGFKTVRTRDKFVFGHVKPADLKRLAWLAEVSRFSLP